MSNNNSRNESISQKGNHSNLNESKENENNANYTNLNVPLFELIWVSREFVENFDINSLKNIPKCKPRIEKEDTQVQTNHEPVMNIIKEVETGKKKAERIKQKITEKVKSKYRDSHKDTKNVFITKNCNIVISVGEEKKASISALTIDESFNCDEEFQKILQNFSNSSEHFENSDSEYDSIIEQKCIEYKLISEFYFEFMVKEKEEIREPLADLKNLTKYDDFFIEDITFESQNKNNTGNLILIISSQFENENESKSESKDQNEHKFKVTYAFDQIKKLIEQNFLPPKRYFSKIFTRNETKEEQPKQDQNQVNGKKNLD